MARNITGYNAIPFSRKLAAAPGLPSWIILEGMKIGEAVQDRQIPAVRTADAIRTQQAKGNKASAAGSVATSSTQSGHAQNAKEEVCGSL